jgi:hypothetical protein
VNQSGTASGERAVAVALPLVQHAIAGELDVVAGRRRIVEGKAVPDRPCGRAASASRRGSRSASGVFG